MKRYYYTDGTSQFGPFDIEELKTKSLTRQTLSWFEGLDSWKKAGEIPELNSLFSLPPLINQVTDKKDAPVISVVYPPKKIGKTWAQIFSIICIVVSVVAVLFGILLLITASANNYHSDVNSTLVSLGSIIIGLGSLFLVYSITMTVYIRR